MVSVAAIQLLADSKPSQHAGDDSSIPDAHTPGTRHYSLCCLLCFAAQEGNKKHTHWTCLDRLLLLAAVLLLTAELFLEGGLPFFLEFDTSQSVPCTQPRVNEPLELKKTQTKKGNTKYSQSTTILFSTLFFIHHFFETTQFESQEKK